MVLMPIIDARLQDLHFGQTCLAVMLGLGQGDTVLGLDIMALGETAQHELCVAEEEEVGLLIVAFVLVDFGLEEVSAGRDPAGRRQTSFSSVRADRSQDESETCGL